MFLSKSNNRSLDCFLAKDYFCALSSNSFFGKMALKVGLGVNVPLSNLCIPLGQRPHMEHSIYSFLFT